MKNLRQADLSFCLIFLDDHITQLHGDGSHSCSGCYTVFRRPTLLRKHQQGCKKYKIYLKEQSLLAHDAPNGELAKPPYLQIRYHTYSLFAIAVFSYRFAIA